MSQWNLSVRLTGQGSDLSRTLRRTVADARAASRDVNALRRDITGLRAAARRPIRLRLSVDGRHLRSDIRAAVNGASAGSRIRIPLGVDATSLRSEVRRALGSARGQALSVGLRVDDPTRLRRDVDAAIRAAAAGQRILIPVGLADAGRLRRDVDAAVRTASAGQQIRIPVGGDTTRLSGSAADTGSAFSVARKDLLLFAAALLPIVASAIPVAKSLAAAGAGATAFGVAIAGQIATLTEAAEAQKEYDDAVAEHGKHSQEAIKAETQQQRLLKKMPAATRETAAAYSVLKEEYRDWTDALAGDTMPVATKSLQLMTAVLPHLTPMVGGAADEFDRLVTYAGAEMNTPGFDRMMDRISDASTHGLHEIVDGLIALSEASQGMGDNPQLEEFFTFCRENGPLVADTLQNVTGALLHILAAGADTGVGILTLANAFAQLVNAVPPSLLSALIQLYTISRLVSVGMGAMGAAANAGLVARLMAFNRAVQFGGARSAIGGVVQGMSRMSKVAGGLGVLGIAAYAIDALADKARGAPPDVDKLTTSLKELANTGKFTGELEKTFGSMDGYIQKLNTLRAEEKLIDQSGFMDWSKKLGVGPGIDYLLPKIDDLVNGTKSMGAMKEDFQGVDEALAQLATSGHADTAASEFKKFETAMRNAGYSTKDINKVFPEYKTSVAGLKADQDLAAQSMGVFGKAALDTKSKLDAQKASADGLRQSIVALNDVNRAGGSAMSAFEQSIDDVAKAAAANAGALTMNHGELDRNSQKARDADAALRDLATNTDAAATAAREQGKSWEYVNGIYERGRGQFVKAAQAMGLTRDQAQALSREYLNIPDKKTTKLEMRTEDAVTSLDSVIAAIKKTPNAKSVTVKALTRDAITLLESLGFKVKRLPDGRFKVTAATATAQESLGAVRAARDSLKSKNISVGANTGGFWAGVRGLIGRVLGTSYINVAHRRVDSSASPRFADGGIVAAAYANGGIRASRIASFATGGTEPGDRPNQHKAQITPAGSYRVWGEEETQGEGYVPFRRSARPRSRAITEEIVRRLGGDPATIHWNADGSVTDWRYDPQSGSLYSPSDAGAAGNKTRKVKTKVKGKWVTKEVEYFDIGAVEKKLKSAAAATRAWNKDLETVANRVGGDVAEALASMGKEGEKLADKMARGSTKYINDMAKALRDLKKTAKASLTDYTRQLGTANKLNKTFSDDLATLAARGYGDLAKQLAAQNDKAAQELAAAAVKDKGKASKANKAAKTANNALTGDQVEQLVAIIAAISKPTTGIHDVAAVTGLGEDAIIATAGKATGQIKKALGGRASRFLADLAKAQKGMAYADGGIRSGIYATKGGAVTFAEPSTGGEAFIPLGADKRRHALPVLSDVAGRFGLGLRDANEGRVIVIRQPAPLVGTQTWNVTSGDSSENLARRIDADNSYQLRRLARGGVGARG
ncbi:hypothetical protein ABZ383_32230 [Streptomyces sp. NPDC005900]|uniref:hypothetical protein n=1 Tax=Streptomyces sp. NPDC005900 TaxID=3154569 RepID=UPI0033F08C9D